MSEKIEFKNIQISKEDLNRILDAGMMSPTAKSLQPQKIYVVESQNGLKKLKDLTNYYAPTALIVCGNIEQSYKKNYYVSYKSDCILVSLHMILEATYLGIDNLYFTNIDLMDKLEKEFELGINNRPVSLIFLGYKTDDSLGFKASDFNCNLLPKYKKNKEDIVKNI